LLLLTIRIGSIRYFKYLAADRLIIIMIIVKAVILRIGKAEHSLVDINDAHRINQPLGHTAIICMSGR